VAHQWFYGVVGNNQYLHAYLDESLSNYLSVVYFAANYDAETANEQANYELRSGYFDYLFRNGDDIVDQPTDSFRSGGVYGVIVYGKGALAFMELRAEIGTDAFFAALQSYYATYAFGIATPADMKAAFEEAAGTSLEAFWTHWFNEAAGLDDFDATDVARLLREMGD
jgi:aminopeptidase N